MKFLKEVEELPARSKDRRRGNRSLRRKKNVLKSKWVKNI